MQIAEGQLGLVHVNGKVTPTAPREVLDITVPTVFSGRDSASSFDGDLVVHLRGEVGAGTDVGTLGEREVGFRAAFVEVGRFQGGFAFVPGVEEFLRGGCSAEEDERTVIVVRPICMYAIGGSRRPTHIRPGCDTPANLTPGTNATEPGIELSAYVTKTLT
jgi:hypothetical protein